MDCAELAPKVSSAPAEEELELLCELLLLERLELEEETAA